MNAVQRLINAGAEVQVKDSNGHSPYELAKQEGKPEVAKYLDQVGKTAAESHSNLATLMTSSTVNTLSFPKTPDSITTAKDSKGMEKHNRGGGSQIKQQANDTKSLVEHQTSTKSNGLTKEDAERVSRTDHLAIRVGIDLLSTWIWVIVLLFFFMFGLNISFLR